MGVTEVLQLVLGASSAVAGVIARKCPPANAMGPLMIGLGVARRSEDAGAALGGLHITVEIPCA